MTRNATNKLLIAFHAAVLGAIFLRIDYFPLTCVPMYSQFHGIEDLTLPVGDMPRMKRGDAGFIVRAEAVSDFATFTREQRRQGQLDSYKMTRRNAVLTAENIR